MLKSSFLALAVTASFATSASAQSGPTCPSGEPLQFTATECTEFGGQLSADNRGCALTQSSLAKAQEALCVVISTQAQPAAPGAGAAGGAGAGAAGAGIGGAAAAGAAAAAAIGLAIAVAVASDDDNTTTTTTTTTD